MTDAPLAVEQRGAVALLTLDRPHRLNSLTPGLMDAIHAALVVARDAPETRAVVVTGRGRGFSAGADLSDAATTDDVRTLLARHYAPVVRLLGEMETPVVAAVNGVAAGAGLSLALACDFRVAARSARLVSAFARIGLVPDAGMSWVLPRLVGLAAALEITMLGEPVDMERAQRLGLVTRVVDDDRCLPEALALAERLAAGPRSLGLMKRALRTAFEGDLSGHLRIEEDLQALAMRTADAAEGTAAFAEKREPRFTGT